MLHGSCACGRIRYEIRGELLTAPGHCHCWQCRKHAGASFGTTAPIRTADLHFTQGEELLQSWESSPGNHRHFAGCCGSPLFKRIDAHPEVLGFRLGTLDCDPGGQVAQHIFVDSKVPWVELDDTLPKRPGGAPFPQRG